MSLSTKKPNVPSELVVGGARYVLEPTVVSVSTPTPTNVVKHVLMTIDDERLAILPLAHAGALACGPVYRSVPNGTLVVPTGRVFVRFSPDVNVATTAESLRQAGFEIVARPHWARDCAWVSSGSSKTDGLTKLDVLSRVPGVSHWEPELLRPRASKATPK